jgi:magnesium transporter
MIKEIFYNKEIDFRWVDVISPTDKDFEELSTRYNLHPAAVKDCLSPMHLPKCELISGVVFMVLRLYDHKAADDADDVGELTNKMAIFSSDRFLITIHRKNAVYLTDLKRDWGDLRQIPDPSRSHLFNEIIDNVLHTYDSALLQDTQKLDLLEKRIFDEGKNKSLIWDLYLVKRRVSIFQRMLQLTRSTLEKFRRYDIEDDPFSNDLLETADLLFFTADNLHENTNNLINLHLSLVSHRSNEVMGVLTMISVFFLPLTFIVGVYGMNFEYMPELKHPASYFVVWGIMIGITAGIYVWFRRNKWL